MKSLLLLLCLAFMIVVLAIWGNQHASHRFSGITRGMTKAQVDHYLWDFSRFSAVYDPMYPTDFEISYEFLWFGKLTRISVQYDANGTVIKSAPIFDN